MSLRANAEHPAGEFDLRRHGIELLVSVRKLQSQHLGTVCNAFSLRAQNQLGHLVVTGSGDLADGMANIAADANLMALPITAVAFLSAEQLDVGQVGSQFMPELDVQTKLNIRAHAKVDGSLDAVAFASSVRARASEIKVEGIGVADVVSEVTASGCFAWKDVASVAGKVDGVVSSAGVSVKDVANRFDLPTSTGQVSLASDFHASLADLASLDSYELNASIKTSNVSVGELTLKDTTGSFRIESGLAVAELRDATIIDCHSLQVASCNASVKTMFAETESVSAGLRLSLSPTTSLARMLGADESICGGDLIVDGSASCVLSQIAMPSAWNALAELTTRDLAFAGESIGDVDAQLTLSAGKLTLPAFPIQWRDNRCTIAATGSLEEQLEISGKLLAEPVRIADVSDLLSKFSSEKFPAEGLATMDGEFQLTTGPLDFAASGSMKLSGASYSGTAIGKADLAWSADLKGIKLRSSSNAFLGGQYVVEANAKELDWTKTLVEGQFQNIQVARLAAFSGQKIALAGVVDGGVRVTSIANLESLAGRAWIKSRGLQVDRIPVEIALADVSLQSSKIVASCEGTIADGRYRGNATSELAQLIVFTQTPNRKISQLPVIAQGRLEDLPLESLARRLQLPQELRTLGGRLSASCMRDRSMLDGSALCAATASVSDLQVNRVRLSDRITSDISVLEDRIELRRIDGRFADGRLSGKAQVRIASNPTGSFEFAASRVNLRRASAPFVSQPVTGTGALLLRGRIGQVINGRADVSVHHGAFAGVSVPNAKFPIDWSYSLPSKVARWNCRAGMASVGGGTVRISSEGSYSTSLNMTTSARIQRVDSSKLMRGKSVGAGIVSGTMTLQAKRARSIKQFAGKYELTLANVKTLEIPVLDHLPSMVSLSPPRPGQGEDGGTVHGRIAGGLVYVDQLSISQSNIQVMMSGNATLDGRLDFDVTASTQANGPTDQLLELADSPLMLAAPAPIALVAKANDLLKDRVVHVHVGGIASRPTLRLQPGKQLSQDAVRFFLKNSFGSTTADLATRQSQPPRR